LNIEKVTEAQEQARREYEEKMRQEAQLARSVEAESLELAAYNDHLAELAKQPRKKLWGH
jgi:anti-sigma-K factor RskA